MFSTGALDLGIHHLSSRFRERGPLLIAVRIVLFGLLGSIKGWSDETLGLYAMMVPLMMALGYDRMVTVAVVTVASLVGALASTINPILSDCVENVWPARLQGVLSRSAADQSASTYPTSESPAGQDGDARAAVLVKLLGVVRRFQHQAS
jgi:C4-dicarboxylate anaerobic carrier